MKYLCDSAICWESRRPVKQTDKTLHGTLLNIDGVLFMILGSERWVNGMRTVTSGKWFLVLTCPSWRWLGSKGGLYTIFDNAARPGTRRQRTVAASSSRQAT